jgi:hypothetical protein
MPSVAFVLFHKHVSQATGWDRQTLKSVAVVVSSITTGNVQVGCSTTLAPADLQITDDDKVSHKPILIAGTSIASVIVFTIFVLLLRCCLRSRTAEYRPLLPTSGTGIVRRSSTFYQFNRNVPGSRRKPSLTERPWPNARRISGPATSSPTQAQEDDNGASADIDVPNRPQNDYKAVKWDERRKELLKKYGKSPDR